MARALTIQVIRNRPSEQAEMEMGYVAQDNYSQGFSMGYTEEDFYRTFPTERELKSHVLNSDEFVSLDAFEDEQSEFDRVVVKDF